MPRNMPVTLSIYMTPEFRPVWEVLDGIAARDRVGMSTLIKKALTEWAEENGLDPAYVLKRDETVEVRAAVSAKPPCRFRLMLSPSTLLCKAVSEAGEKKGLAECVECERYDPRRS